MSTDEKTFVEGDPAADEPDPDETPIRDRRLVTNPYDLVVEALIDQIANGTVFLRPISERPSFQRRYVWPNLLASRLIESVLLNVPIPPCYLSQNEDFELDVIDGQQRLFSIYRFVDNQFPISGLEVLKELNGLRFHEFPSRLQRQIRTHTIRCVLISNESHPEIKFDVFERLNTNTVPLNAQELRNCIHRGTLNEFLKDAVTHKGWLSILGKKESDKRMRDEELVLRFLGFALGGIDSYRTPQKHWLNDVAKKGRKYSAAKIQEISQLWNRTIETALVWFEPRECFRRLPATSKTINRALFDLVMHSASSVAPEDAAGLRTKVRKSFAQLSANSEFLDLISRAVDHKKRTLRRFELWDKVMPHPA